MNDTLTPADAARLLGVSLDDVKELDRVGLIHPLVPHAKKIRYSAEEIYRIKSNKGPSISLEAAQVGAQMQQEVVATVSLMRNVFGLLASTLVGFTSSIVLTILIIAVLFKMYPNETSDYFGFYYRYNTIVNPPIFVPEQATQQVLGDSVEVVPPKPIKITPLAKALKPLASVSLLLVKASDSEQYQQIVKIPPGLPGAEGESGNAGQPGKDGAVGATGAQGIKGETGAEGAVGASGPSGPPGEAASSGTIGMIAGNGLSGGGNISLGSSGTLSINAPSCAANERLSWNGANFSCKTVIGGERASANEFYVGPTTGASDFPTFRLIDAADLGSGTANGSTVLMGNLTWLNLLSGGKIDTSLLPDSVTSGLKYKGSWDANTNTPTLSSGASTAGNFYIISVAGSTTIDGISTWNVGDWIVNNGTNWERVPSTSGVSSVNGLSGAVSLTTDEVSQGSSNKYLRIPLPGMPFLELAQSYIRALPEISIVRRASQPLEMVRLLLLVG